MSNDCASDRVQWCVVSCRVVCGTVDGDEVVIVEDDEVAQAEVAGDGRGLGGDALLEATVTAEHVDVVVDDGEPLLVVARGQVPLGDGHAHGVGETWRHTTSAARRHTWHTPPHMGRDGAITLTERSGGDLHAGGLEGLGVAGRLAAHLTEFLGDGRRTGPGSALSLL